MQHPFIQGAVISVPCSFMLHRDTATFQMECETHQKPEERGSLLKVFCPSGFYLLLFTSCLFRGLIRGNFILQQQLFFKSPHEKQPQRQNKIFWGSPSDILSKWHFFVVLSLSLPFLTPSLKLAKQLPSWKSLGQHGQAHSLGWALWEWWQGCLKWQETLHLLRLKCSKASC